MKNQNIKITHEDSFDSCSVDELIGCMRARVIWIREFRRFKNDSVSKKYPNMFASGIFSMLNNKHEIQWINQTIRKLRQSGCKNMTEYKAKESREERSYGGNI
jgi:hypothetical protein